MTSIDDFRKSASAANPPADLGPALQGLWWLAHGDWDKAHKSVQGHEGKADCDWVHAHLHRQEGDLNNAGYWYKRAGKPVSKDTLDDEWRAITGEMLARR